MTTPPISIASTLDEIRQVEAEVARQLQVAQAAAEERIAQAEEAARTIQQASLAAGRREGEADCQEIIACASREAERLIRAESLYVESLRHVQAHQLESLIRCILECVTGIEARQVPYEPQNAVPSDHRP